MTELSCDTEESMNVRFEPTGVIVEVEAGVTLLEAANAAGIEIETVCGGRGTCAKCKVIAGDGMSPLTALEAKGLTEAEIRAGYRLACQAVVESDVEVTVPEASRISRVSILSEGIEGSLQLEPWVRRLVLQVPAATLEDQVSDLENVARCWRAQANVAFKPALRALRQLPLALRKREGRISLVQVDDLVVWIGAGDSPKRLLGIAFDIGTTTVVGYLMDLESGEQLAVSSMLNPQTRCGDDVVSRIDFASQNETGLQTLQREIRGALNQIIADTTGAASASAEDVLAMTVVGNTTMQHLFLGIDPAALAQSPYVPAVTAAQCLTAGELGIAIYPDAHVWCLPNIAGWVGADAVGVILATGIHERDEVGLAVDIGTNGEMALGSRERLITCSTAAGPAFEGAHVSCGMRASDGAIDEVRINADVQWRVIGDRLPAGICGSGLVDVVAEMLRVGIIDSTGMMRDGADLRRDGRKSLADRIVRAGGRRGFRLVDASAGAGGRAIMVNQRDVRELQLAKGAIRAGIEILVKELGIDRHDVKRVYLAGAFGNYIRAESALAIGLLPRFPDAEIVPVGNAAGSGAKKALLSKSARNEASRIVATVEYLELSARPDFQEEFIEAMVF